jgi:hypothetical protein
VAFGTGFPALSHKFARPAPRYRTIQIQAGPHTITAADLLPDDLQQAIETINHTRPAH